MENIVNYALVAFTSFFSVMNPVGVMPLFLSMTAGLELQHRRRTAVKACTVAFITLVIFGVLGEFIFNFFGISVNGLRVVGGFIFFKMGSEMLQAQVSKMKLPDEEVKKYVGDISVTPLAIPMITGPGAITNAMLLMQVAVNLSFKAVLVGVMLIVCLIMLLALLFASRIISLLGSTGINVLVRLMGLIVMVVAIEFFISGLTPIIRSVFLVE
ncbi:MAG: MarC family protein [Thermaurantimonas sp.]|uniref:MarC family protein n=1 Tax=Thermaurantimonas sp. TaxID=2681568 RepID=UPI003918878D